MQYYIRFFLTFIIQFFLKNTIQSKTFETNESIPNKKNINIIKKNIKIIDVNPESPLVRIL